MHTYFSFQNDKHRKLRRDKKRPDDRKLRTNRNEEHSFARRGRATSSGPITTSDSLLRGINARCMRGRARGEKKPALRRESNQQGTRVRTQKYIHPPVDRSIDPRQREPSTKFQPRATFCAIGMSLHVSSARTALEREGRMNKSSFDLCSLPACLQSVLALLVNDAKGVDYGSILEGQLLFTLKPKMSCSAGPSPKRMPLMASKHLDMCGCTARGSRVCERISSSSSFDRKKNLPPRAAQSGVSRCLGLPHGLRILCIEKGCNYFVLYRIGSR